MKKEILVIYVSGGVVQEVRTNAPTITAPTIQLFDVDDLHDTNTSHQIESKWEEIVKQCPNELPIV